MYDSTAVGTLLDNEWNCVLLYSWNAIHAHTVLSVYWLGSSSFSTSWSTPTRIDAEFRTLQRAPSFSAKLEQLILFFGNDAHQAKCFAEYNFVYSFLFLFLKIFFFLSHYYNEFYFKYQNLSYVKKKKNYRRIVKYHGIVNP